jgi:hypothetical protein
MKPKKIYLGGKVGERRKGTYQTIYNKHLLDEYFAKNKKPVCFHCKKEIYQTPHMKGALGHNSATIDHIYSRKDIRAYLVKEKKNTVPACHECNEKRAHEENEQMAKDYRGIEKINLIEILKQAS